MKRFYKVLFALIVILNLAPVFRHAQQAASGAADFKSFYTAATLLNDGQGSRIYERTAQEQAQNRLYPPPQSVFLPFIQPPYVLPLFSLLAWLQPEVAYYVWMFCNFLLAIMSGFLLGQGQPGAGYSTFVPLALFPVAVAILQGQTVLLVLLALVLCFRAIKSDRPFTAGLVLALSLIKFNFVLPLLLWALLRKRWRMLAGTACGATLLGLVALAIGGIGLITDYLLLVRYHAAWINPNTNPNMMPNLRGLLYGVVGNASWAAWITAFLLLALLGFWVLRQRMASSSEFAIFIALAVFISPHTNVHDLSLLFLPGWLALRAAGGILLRWTADSKQIGALVAHGGAAGDRSGP